MSAGKRAARGGGTNGRSVRRLIGRSRIGIQTIASPWNRLLSLRCVAVHSAEGSWIAALYAARLGAVGGWIRETLAVRGSGFAEVLPSRRDTVRIFFAVETLLTYLQRRSHCFIRWIRSGNGIELYATNRTIKKLVVRN